jgi:hypothetical protein
VNLSKENWRGFVNTVMNVHVLYKCVELLFKNGSAVWNLLVGRILFGLVLASERAGSLFRDHTSTESHRACGVVVRPYTCMPGSSRLESRPSHELS